MDPAYADEKLVVQHIDEVARLEASIDPALESKLVWRLDLFILPLGTSFHMLSYFLSENELVSARKEGGRLNFGQLTF